jgi:hypothetical protein
MLKLFALGTATLGAQAVGLIPKLGLLRALSLGSQSLFRPDFCNSPWMPRYKELQELHNYADLDVNAPQRCFLVHGMHRCLLCVVIQFILNLVVSCVFVFVCLLVFVFFFLLVFSLARP